MLHPFYSYSTLAPSSSTLSTHVPHFPRHLPHFSTHVPHFHRHLPHYSTHILHFPRHIPHFSTHIPPFLLIFHSFPVIHHTYYSCSTLSPSSSALFHSYS